MDCFAVHRPKHANIGKGRIFLAIKSYGTDDEVFAARYKKESVGPLLSQYEATMIEIVYSNCSYLRPEDMDKRCLSVLFIEI